MVKTSSKFMDGMKGLHQIKIITIKICVNLIKLQTSSKIYKQYLQTGNFISHISEKLGDDVTRITYLGDWGTQFGYLAVGYER